MSNEINIVEIRSREGRISGTTFWNLPQLKSLFPAMYDTVAGRILAVRGLEFNEIIAAKI